MGNPKMTFYGDINKIQNELIEIKNEVEVTFLRIEELYQLILEV
jgi:hypothetical protein